MGLDPDSREAVDRALDPARAEAPAGLRWIRPNNWHFTLRFLGSVEEALQPAVEGALERAAGRNTPFELELSGSGAFPNPRRAKVVWIGAARGADALARLAADVVVEAEALGFEREDRAFHAHLTVARLRRPASVMRTLAAIRPLAVTQPVRELRLYRSHLAQSGARYEVLARFALGGEPRRHTSTAASST